MKYRPSPALAREAAHLMAAAIPQLFPSFDWDLATTVPPSLHGLETRLFAPTDLLARATIRTLGTRAAPTVLNDTLTWSRTPRPQASLQRSQRARNIRGAFSVIAPVSGKRILLIDDVITTGATLAEATSALHTAGALSVDWLALTRVRFWNPLPAAVTNV